MLKIKWRISVFIIHIFIILLSTSLSISNLSPPPGNILYSIYLFPSVPLIPLFFALLSIVLHLSLLFFLISIADLLTFISLSRFHYLFHPLYLSFLFSFHLFTLPSLVSLRYSPLIISLLYHSFTLFKHEIIKIDLGKFCSLFTLNTTSSLPWDFLSFLTSPFSSFFFPLCYSSLYPLIRVLIASSRPALW